MVIVRGHLRDAIRDEIRSRILRGELAPGAQLQEVVLAEALGVSRTPVREALLSLESEGFVASQPAKGFHVRTLDTDEARDLYPVVAALEGLALRLSGERARALTGTLSEIVEKLRGTKAGDRRFRLDQEFHSTMLSACPNPRLLSLIESQKQVLERYERAFMEHRREHPTADEHSSIVIALEKGRVAEAAALLEAHWRTGLEALLDHLS